MRAERDNRKQLVRTASPQQKAQFHVAIPVSQALRLVRYTAQRCVA